MKAVFYYIYGQPILNICVILLIIGSVWNYIGYKVTNTVRLYRLKWGILYLYIFSVVYYTIFMRTNMNYSTAQIIPFYSVYKAITNTKDFEQIYLNIVLFVPFGFILFDLLKQKEKLKIITLAALLLSVGIEVTQFYGRIGKFETDDIIFNVLGAGLGCAIYFFTKGIQRKLINIYKTFSGYCNRKKQRRS